MRLIDAHAHVQAEVFDADRSEVINAARGAGVERMLVPGWDLSSSRAALVVGAQFALDAGVGIHPHVARDSDRDFPAIADLARDPLVVAVGETGLCDHRASRRATTSSATCAATCACARAEQAGHPALPLEAGRA